MCWWCDDETATESALSVVVYYCCQWKRNLNLAAQPAVNQYFTGSVLWRDDTKTDLKEGDGGEGKKERKRRIYLDIRWHTFPPKVRENRHRWCWGSVTQQDSLQQPLQQLLVLAGPPCYHSATKGIKPSSDKVKTQTKNTLFLSILSQRVE